jgi:hypothetical protein
MSKIYYFLIVILFASASILQTSNVITDKQYHYIGTKACKKCHIKQFKSWEKTKMAKAYDILKPGERGEAKKKVGLDPEKDYTKDPECLPCHTTGFGHPGGFISIDQTPQLVGVSCETCHGAGSEYTKLDLMHTKNKEYKLTDVVQAGLVSPVTGEMCTSLCHNEKSPFFDKNEPFNFKKRKDQGTHEQFPLKYKHD